MIVLDTSILIGALGKAEPEAGRLRQAIAAGERIILPTLVLYEWRRGPRTADDVAAQEALFPTEQSVAFGTEEALIAADLYREVPRPRGREVDLAIAACAISWGAVLWTNNRADFEDVPGLDLWLPTP